MNERDALRVLLRQYESQAVYLDKYARWARQTDNIRFVYREYNRKLAAYRQAWANHYHAMAAIVRSMLREMEA